MSIKKLTDIFSFSPIPDLIDVIPAPSLVILEASATIMSFGEADKIAGGPSGRQAEESQGGVAIFLSFPRRRESKPESCSCLKI